MAPHEWLAVAMLLSFVALLLTGFPVAWILGGLAVFYTAIAIVARIDLGFDALLVDWAFTSLVVDRVWNLMQSWVLVALPLFIFMGLMLDRSRVAERLLVNFANVFGRVRGGLAVTIAVVGVLLAASTGIVGASVTLLTVLGLPVMLRHRYAPSLAAGTCAAAGTLGILIPPSIMLVIMGDSLSIAVGELFLGALFPGLLLSGLYVVYILGFAQARADAAPVPNDLPELRAGVVLSSLGAVLPAFGLIVAVLGSIFAGMATPTEAAGIGALGAIALAAANRRLTFPVLRDTCRQTTHTTAYIFAIMIGATAFSLVLRGLGGDHMIERALTWLPFGPSGTVVAILGICFLLGFLLDWIEITLVVLPLVVPVIEKHGFDPVWFTVMFAIVLQTSFLTPPVGFSLFYLRGVAPSSLRSADVYRGVVPFVLLILLALAVCFFWRDIILWLPRVAYH